MLEQQRADPVTVHLIRHGERDLGRFGLLLIS